MENNRNKIQYVLYALIVLGMIVKLILFDYQYVDYGFYLSRWVGEIKANGYLHALKDPFYNYTPTYMYLLVLIAKLDLYPLYAIKIVSVAFDYILAFFVGRLAFLYCRKSIVMWLSFAIVPLAPTILFNSAFMSQCDSLYVSFILGSVYFALSKRQIASMIFLGIAFALKIQTAMILPFFFLFMLRGNIKWYLFLIVPVVYLVSILPVWMVGRPFFDLLTIYLGQAEYNTELVKNFPNIYLWIGYLGDWAKLFGVLLVLGFTLAGGFLLSRKKYNITIELWYKYIFLGALVCPFLLPGMLERYMYLGDVVALLCAFVFGRKYILTAIGVIFVSFYSYVRCIYMFSFSGDALYPSVPFKIFESLPWEIVSVLYIFLIGFVCYDFMQVLNKEMYRQVNVDDKLII